MKNLDIEYLISISKNRGRNVSRFEARTYLGAKEVLAKDPKNEIAEKVVEEFVTFTNTGSWPMHQGGRSFAPFALGLIETDEERQCMTERA